MKTIYFILFLSYNLLITSVQEKYITIDNTKENYQEKIALKESVKRGRIIYLKKCARCHKKDGKGKLKVFPPLAQSDYLISNQEESIKAIKYGLKEEIFVNSIRYKRRMPRVKLKDEQIADVMNYISNSWGNKNEKVITKKEVESISKI